MKLKITNRDIIGLYNTLESLDYKGVKFAYNIARNLSLLKPLMNSFDKALAIPKEFTEYEKARVELAKKHADKDEKGKPKTEQISIPGVMEKTHFVIKDMPAFEKELDELQEKHKGVIDARQKQLDEYKALQDEEVEVEVISIPQMLLPADITTKELTSIFPLLEEDKSVVSPLSDEMTGKENKE